MADMFYVYLLHSIADDGFYIGYTTDLRKRLIEHEQGASFATRHRQPWKLYLKSSAGRRLLRHQLRYYLEKFPSRSKHVRPQAT
jgi:predicted GIY-YIG superfamily endonuclease